ncbi:hypothetical protein AXX16_2724 [Serratia rubidaea]|nr:hypothetical protein AXX16_2724 [Serratia rubidaea]
MRQILIYEFNNVIIAEYTSVFMYLSHARVSLLRREMLT